MSFESTELKPTQQVDPKFFYSAPGAMFGYVPFGIFSDDYRDYLEKPRPKWNERRGSPVTGSSAAVCIGILFGLVVGWATDLREAPAGIVGGIGGMLLFDFYWRWVKDTLPLVRRR